MTIAILFCLLLTVVYSIPHQAAVDSTLDAKWNVFKSIFGKHYDGENEISRRLIWEENVRKILKHNVEYSLGRQTYSMGVNQFSDLKHEKMRSTDISKFMANPKRLPGFGSPLKLQQGALPDSVDWRTKGCVTPVRKLHAWCGSYAAATGAMEGQYCIRHKNLIRLSTQELLDCHNVLFRSKACQSSESDLDFVFASLYGMASDSGYPYTGYVGQCNWTAITVKNVASFAGYHILHEDLSTLQTAVATMGPITTGLLYNENFIDYKGGIFDDYMCGGTIGTHSVLIVGYGIENGTKYWIIKNSWGTQWGENGYMRMKMDITFACGNNYFNIIPIIRV